LHSMLPTIDMPEPTQELVPAFGTGGLAATCSTTECCCGAILSVTSAVFAAAFLSFSGALLLNNMCNSVFAGMQCETVKSCRCAQRKRTTLRLGCRLSLPSPCPATVL